MKKEAIQKNYEVIKKSIDNLASFKRKGELYFFVVSIDKYQKETNLRNSNKLAEEFINIFKQYHQIKSKNLYWLFDENATKINILNQLEALSKSIRNEDKLILYFSGHGYKNELADFFVPFDGNKNNFNSCIPGDFIFETLAEYQSNSILLNFDLNLSKSEWDLYKSAVDVQPLARYMIPKQEDSLFNKYFKFFNKSIIHRIKESYLILRELTSKALVAESIINQPYNFDKGNNDLLRYLSERHNNFFKLIVEHKTPLVLTQLSNILENNDPVLYSSIRTLNYKLDEYERLYSLSKVTQSEYKSNKRFIDEITCEVIEKLKRRGFFLVKTPKIPDTKLLPYKEKTKILFASANPVDTEPLRLDKEAREIEYELLKSKNRDNFELIKSVALRIEDLQHALLNINPQFIHFSGHGNCDGIALLNNDDEVIIVKSKPLSELFKLFAKDIQCVFLNSCHSINQSNEISKYIDKVICMNSSVPDSVAIHFAMAFYRSLASGRDIDFSFKFAKNSIDLHNIMGSDIPILLTQTA